MYRRKVEATIVDLLLQSASHKASGRDRGLTMHAEQPQPKNICWIGIAVISALVMAGCTKPYMRPEIASGDGFPGVGNLLQSAGTVDFVAIHGMCYHDTSWLKDNVKNLATMLEGTAEVDANGDAMLAQLPGTPNVPAYRARISKGNTNVNVYGIFFSPLTQDLKRTHLCDDVDSATPLCPNGGFKYKRASINSALKNTLMNECLADVPIYLSSKGREIRDGVRTALVQISADRGGAERPTVLISQSLGSKILADSILCASPNQQAIIYPFTGTVTHFIMASNQIQLLGLGPDSGSLCSLSAARSRLPGGGAEARMLPHSGGIAGLLDVIEANRGRAIKSASTMRANPTSSASEVAEATRVLNALGTTVHIVAFSDPNDLLTYHVSPSDIGQRPVNNVVISNKRTWFGLIENPYGAHTSYLTNTAIHQAIVNGCSANEC